MTPNETPELEVWLCPVHESLDKNGGLKPLDNCVACLRVERDELLALVASVERERDEILAAARNFLDAHRVGKFGADFDALSRIVAKYTETEPFNA